MSTIILQIILSLNLLLGLGNHKQLAQQIYASGTYTTSNSSQDGIVIIDGDELGCKKK